jgi:hypothetical protein
MNCTLFSAFEVLSVTKNLTINNKIALDLKLFDKIILNYSPEISFQHRTAYILD